MAAPAKPWENIAGGLNRQSIGPGPSFFDQMSSNVPTSSIPRPFAAQDSRLPPVRPARPQRPSVTNGFSNNLGYGGLGSFGGGFSSYNGYGGFGGLGGYSPFGGSMYGGYGMNRLGFSDDYNSNSFAQQAELSSRHAFQSIESVVQVFSSIAMMLESTFQAVYNSFRAVVGVADHFSRMKSQLAQIFSALAIFRAFRWLVRKFLVLLRLRTATTEDKLWNKAMEASTSMSEDGTNDKPQSTWPVMVFFALVVGGPWLIWKLLSSFSGGKGTNAWASGLDEHYVAKAEFDFQGENNDELSFKQGTEIILAPKELQPRIRGWLLASIDGKTTGIVPQNYIKIMGRRPGSKTPVSTPHQAITLPGNIPSRTQSDVVLPASGTTYRNQNDTNGIAGPSLEMKDTESEFEQEFGPS